MKKITIRQLYNACALLSLMLFFSTNQAVANDSSDFCATPVTHFSIASETASAALITIENFDANSMKVEVTSADSDPIDLFNVLGSHGANVSEATQGSTWSRILSWDSPPSPTVNLNLLWSKESFDGNWQLNQTDITVPFNASCSGSTDGGSTGGGSSDGGSTDGSSSDGTTDGNAPTSSVEMTGVFGGALYNAAASTYTIPAGSESWAGFANLNEDIYPFTFANGGSITFTAAIPAGGSDTDIFFRFEKNPYPDTEPSFNLDAVTISGETEISYTVPVPAKSAANTYSSFLLYVVEQDQPVIVKDIFVTDDSGTTYDSSDGGSGGDNGTIQPIDSSKWFHQTKLPNGSGWYNNEQQHYTDRIENSYVSNGTLKIAAIKEAYTDQGHTKQFTSARLNSKYAFKYGRVVVRAKLPTGAETWPAIWTLGKNISEPGAYWQTQGYGTTPWPYCGEIDIMEHWGNNQNYVSSAMHTPSSHGGTVNVGGQYISTVSSQFHNYEMDWNSERIIFSVDGNEHYRYAPTEKNSDTWPYDDEQYLILNVAIQGGFSSNFTQSAMEIDYVRVYAPNAGASAQPIWSDEFNTASGVDTDGDGIDNSLDPDDDNDTYVDTIDAFPLDNSEWLDTDSDGTGNNADTDDDNDTYIDSVDLFPLIASEWADADSDGTGDNADTDDDNDTVIDSLDAFPLDPLEWADTDGDGTGNNADTDDDNDTVIDSLDSFPLLATESIDTDGDGTGDNADIDDDGDGVLDSLDSYPLDSSNTPTNMMDIDGNGEIDGLTDIMLVLRYVFGFSGETLINGALGDNATRTSAAEIEAHLESMMPGL